MADPSRRSFIKTISGSTLALCCGSTGLSVLLNSCTSIKYIQPIIKNNKITVSINEFAENKFVVVNTEQLPSSIYLNKINDSSYSALLMLCTHKNCSVNPTGSFLTCPCHGSQFSNKGKVLRGPAEERLTEYQVLINEKQITIDLNQAIKL
ncbi:MAG: Rieske (2Fe-2S) protein [Flavobacteriales bacterium]|nr:Rieske (2Fe-2S) protein [Flavobacteriales bacterium]